MSFGILAALRETPPVKEGQKLFFFFIANTLKCICLVVEGNLCNSIWFTRVKDNCSQVLRMEEGIN